jgi:hypothetical protein
VAEHKQGRLTQPQIQHYAPKARRYQIAPAPAAPSRNGKDNAAPRETTIVMRILLLYAYITTAAGAGKQCNRPPGGPASCPAPPDAANNKNCAATSCPAPPPDRFKGKKKVKVGTFDPTDIPEPPRRPLRFLKLADEDDEELELRLAAAEGRADAQYNLGTMFDGQGATSDPQEAARNYREAANQGHASAQFNLGNMYRKGLGVEKSYVEAARLYKAAGQSKHKKAQANLDHLLQKGYVTEEDLIVVDEDEESKTYPYIYLAVMALLLLVIPSRILKRYRDAVAALEALEKEESPVPPKSPPRKAVSRRQRPSPAPPGSPHDPGETPPTKSPARKRVTWSEEPPKRGRG